MLQAPVSHEPRLIPEDVWTTFYDQHLNKPNMKYRDVVEAWYAHGDRLIQEYEARRSAAVTLEELPE